MAMVASSALCVCLGVWGSQYRELRPVFFGGGRAGANTRQGSSPSQSRAQVEGEEEDDQDFPRGRGRGRGRDGAGNYEMVSMKADDVNKAA